MRSTPTTAAALERPRVLVCIGSESGRTRRLIKKIVADWTTRGGNFSVEMMDGNDAVKRYGQLEEIAKNFDVLLVATCSYGCGDAPVNISMLLDMLINRATFDEAPLAGLQHAVLGSGSTWYAASPCARAAWIRMDCSSRCICPPNLAPQLRDLPKLPATARQAPRRVWLTSARDAG